MKCWIPENWQQRFNEDFIEGAMFFFSAVPDTFSTQAAKLAKMNNTVTPQPWALKTNETVSNYEHLRQYIWPSF